MKLAYFNPHDNNRVLQWLDTEAFDYELPDASLLHECDDDDWARQEIEAPQMIQGSKVVDYVPVPVSRENLIAASWQAIKAERDRRKAGGVKVGAKWFHTDDGSRIQQMGLVMMGASIPANLQWKTMDHSFVTMTQTLASQVFQAVAASDQAIFTAAETHRVAMEASVDPASYDYSGGWPKIYGE